MLCSQIDALVDGDQDSMNRLEFLKAEISRKLDDSPMAFNKLVSLIEKSSNPDERNFLDCVTALLNISDIHIVLLLC